MAKRPRRREVIRWVTTDSMPVPIIAVPNIIAHITRNIVGNVLIPWNSCGVTQSTVLGVGTLTYLPFCVFNYLSPLMSLLMAWTATARADAALMWRLTKHFAASAGVSALIIGGNMFRNVYRRFGLEKRLLSRTLEDSVSVTSVLIPCEGVTGAIGLSIGSVAVF